MTEQLMLSLLAASTGFIAAFFFCFGAAFTTYKTIASICSTYFNYSEDLARALIYQSTQYLIGGIFLILSFGLQVAAILASPTNLILLPSILQSAFGLILSALFLIGGFAYGLYILLLKIRLKKILPKLEEELG